MGENVKENYLAPATEVLVLKAEGIICESGDELYNRGGYDGIEI